MVITDAYGQSLYSNEQSLKSGCTMNNYLKPTQPVTATTTLEGFIEVTALDELDKIVGGFLNPDEIYLELEESTSSTSVC